MFSVFEHASVLFFCALSKSVLQLFVTGSSDVNFLLCFQKMNH